MKTFLYLIITSTFLFFSQTSFAQKKPNTLPKRPKLVVGIVVDQMRYEYLYKYADRYVDGGFKRLMKEGLNCQENHYNYAPRSLRRDIPVFTRVPFLLSTEL